MGRITFLVLHWRVSFQGPRRFYIYLPAEYIFGQIIDLEWCPHLSQIWNGITFSVIMNSFNNTAKNLQDIFIKIFINFAKTGSLKNALFEKMTSVLQVFIWGKILNNGWNSHKMYITENQKLNVSIKFLAEKNYSQNLIVFYFGTPCRVLSLLASYF